MKYTDEIVACEECGYKFIERISYDITNTEGSREYPYLCPYCNKSYSLKLRGNENLDDVKIEFIDLAESVPINSKTFHRIIDFYLFHCPARMTEEIKPKKGWR